MRAIRFTAVASSVLFLAFAAAPLNAEEKAKDLIIGKWEPIKAQQGIKVVVEFTKEGKINMNVKGKADGKDVNENVGGTFKFLDDNTIEVAVNVQGKKDSKKVKIIKVTKDELTTKDDGATQEDQFKRVK